MAWFGDTFGDGLSSIKGQITKFTNDVLSEDPLAASSFEGKIKQLEEANAALLNEIDKLRSENRSLTSGKGCELSDYQIQSICELESKIYDLTNEKDALTKALDEIETEHQKELDVIIKDRDELKAKCNSSKVVNYSLGEGQISELNEQLKSLQLQNDILFEEGKSKDAELMKYFSDNNILNSQIATLKLQIDQFNDNTLKNSKHILKEKNEKIKLLEDERANMLNKISKLSNKIKILEENYLLEKNKTDDNSKALEELNKSIFEKDESLENLDHCLKKLQDENATLHGKLNEPSNLSCTVDENLKNEIEVFEKKTRNLESQNNVLNEKLLTFGQLSSDNDGLREKCASLEAELSDLKTELVLVEKENIQLKVSAGSDNNLEHKLKSLENDMENLKLKNERLDEICKDYNTQLKEKAFEIDNVKAENNDLLLRIKGTVDENATIVEILTKEKSDLQNEIKKLCAEDSENKLKALNKKLRSEITSLKNAAMKSISAGMQNENSQLKLSYEEKIKQFEIEKNILESKLEELTVQMKGAEELKVEISNITNQNDKLKRRLADIDHKELEAARLMHENSLLRSENEELKKKHTEELTVQTIATEGLKVEISEQQKEILQLKLSYEAKNEQLESEKERLKSELEESTPQRRGTEELKVEISQLTNQNDELRKKLTEIEYKELEAVKLMNENSLLRAENDDLKFKNETEVTESSENQLEVLKSTYKKQFEHLEKENADLKSKIDCFLESSKENELLKNKLEKLEILVARTEERENLVSGTLGMEIRKLKSLVGRIRKDFLRSPNEQAEFCEEEPSGDVMIQSQTDDVKRLQQDVLQMTEVIKMIDQGLTSIYEDKSQLEKELSIVQSLAVKTEQELLLASKAKQQLELNIQEWAAAVNNRDEIIQNLSFSLNKFENDNKALNSRMSALNQELEKKNVENTELNEKIKGMEIVSLEWNKRIEELQNLYKSESERCDDLRKRKDEEIANLNKQIYKVGVVNDNGNSDEALSVNSVVELKNAQDQLARLLDENSDLKMLIQQLRENIIAMNTKLPEISNDDTHQRKTQSQAESEHNELKTEHLRYQSLLVQHNSLIEKESSQRREIERLRAHMVEVEENYTEEAVVAKTELAELRAKLSIVEDQLQKATSVHKSANVRSTQHVEALQVQVQLMAEQRNDLQIQLSDAEDEAQKQAAALASLQLVLEQFQLDKQREMKCLEERLEYQTDLERRRGKELEVEVENLKQQLSEAKNGLKAAQRLGEQLEKKSFIISDLEEEIKKAKNDMEIQENKIKTINQSTNAKVDKFLVKNLIIGYLSAQGEHKNQALKILTSVLELNAEERAKVGVENQGGWLSNILHPSPNSAPTEPLSQAFVRFLESESKPQPQLKLLTDTPKSHNPAKRTPLALSDLVLPPFTPTQVTDTTLSDMLKDS